MMLVPEAELDYYRGTVQTYSDEEGIGYIDPDPEQAIDGLLLFHRSALHSRTMRLVTGDRVVFCVHDHGQDGRALDVQREYVEDSDSENRVRARIHRYGGDRGYGFLTTEDNERAFFHINSFRDENVVPVVGLDVTCQLVSSRRGLQAQDLVVFDSNREPERTDLLAQAILARDGRRYDEAARIYEKGLQQQPSVQLILSWAAMEKNRNRKSAAMRVYEQGIKSFPANAKLREDAGILAASLGDVRSAVRLLEESLSLCRRTQQGGEKGVLLALARTHYQVDTLPALRQSIAYYEQAIQLFGRGRTSLPEADMLRFSIARIRTKHHRGNLCTEFLKAAHFEIIRASLLDQSTEGAEFVVEVENPELRETYGISSHLIVRCMFKNNVVLSDLTHVDQSVKRWASSGLGDEQVALLVVSSLPQELQRLLSNRIEDKRTVLPALVPISQSDLETGGGGALGILRAALDRWVRCDHLSDFSKVLLEDLSRLIVTIT